MIKVEHFTFNPFAENTYVLSNEKDEALIIDPGCYFTEEEKMLQNYITTKRLKPLLLLNTHCHLDHVFGNNWVHKTYGLELHLHEGEVVVLETAPASGNLYGLGFTNYKGPLHFFERR